jgi:hypothetical protein
MKSVSFKAMRRQNAKASARVRKSGTTKQYHVWVSMSAGVSSILDVLGSDGVIYHSGHGAKKDLKNLRSDASAIRKDFAAVMQRPLAD